MTDHEVISRLNGVMSDILQESCSYALRKNKNGVNSIFVKAKSSAYRSTETSELQFAWIDVKDKRPYLRFHPQRYKIFDAAHVPTYRADKSNFVYIDLDEFCKLLDQPEMVKAVLHPIFIGLFSIDSFGCCSRYIECSDAKKCLHPDIVYATACQYRKNLESGRIFYGTNRNI